MMMFKLKRRGCSVCFLWFPAHDGVEGKEQDGKFRGSRGSETP